MPTETKVARVEARPLSPRSPDYFVAHVVEPCCLALLNPDGDDYGPRVDVEFDSAPCSGRIGPLRWKLVCCEGDSYGVRFCPFCGSQLPETIHG